MTIALKLSRNSLLPAMLVAMASIAGSGLLAAYLSPATSIPSHEVAAPLTVTGSVIVEPGATMQIIPADVVDKNPSRFIGTGDGSGGSWMP